MPDFGKYAFYVWTSYGLAGLVLVGITLYTWIDSRVQRRVLRTLEERGLRRRSDRREG